MTTPTKQIRYLVYRRHLDAELSAAEVRGYVARLDAAIRRSYPDAEVEVEVRNNVEGEGAGYQGDDLDVRDHLQQLADRAWNEGVGECSIDACARPVYALGLCEPHYLRAYRAEKKGTSPSRRPVRDPSAPALQALSIRVSPEAKARASADPDGARGAIEEWARRP